MTHASAGIVASLATATITPRATTTVASSTGGPETGTTRAPRMAKYCGSPPCAKQEGVATRSEALAINPMSEEKPMRSHTERMQTPFGRTKQNPPAAVSRMDARGYCEVSHPVKQEPKQA